MEERLRFAKVLDREDVRQTCVRYQWYTRGDNKAYEHMLDMVEKEPSKYTGSTISCDRLEEIADDIRVHSDTTYTTLEIMEILATKIRVEIFHYFK